MNIQIEHMEKKDWSQVCAVSEEGIATGNATFETQAPSWEKWEATHHRAGRLVAESHRDPGLGRVEFSVGPLRV